MAVVATGVISSVIAVGLTVLVSRLYEQTRLRRQLGHLLKLAAQRQVQLVVPGFELREFSVQGSGAIARIPPNVRVMPMAEGAAIADLVRTLRGLGIDDIALVTQDAFRADAPLTISVGGPSVNSVTRAILSQRFPQFTLHYPEHRVTYGSTSLDPELDSDGNLTEDYGFVAITTTAAGERAVLLYGIWAHGTRIATTALLRCISRGSDASDAIYRRDSFILVAHAEVDGLEQAETQIVGMWP